VTVNVVVLTFAMPGSNDLLLTPILGA
jgi:hypothetical protein